MALIPDAAKPLLLTPKLSTAGPSDTSTGNPSYKKALQGRAASVAVAVEQKGKGTAVLLLGAEDPAPLFVWALRLKPTAGSSKGAAQSSSVQDLQVFIDPFVFSHGCEAFVAPHLHSARSHDVLRRVCVCAWVRTWPFLIVGYHQRRDSKWSSGVDLRA